MLNDIRQFSGHTDISLGETSNFLVQAHVHERKHRTCVLHLRTTCNIVLQGHCVTIRCELYCVIFHAANVNIHELHCTAYLYSSPIGEYKKSQRQNSRSVGEEIVLCLGSCVRVLTHISSATPHFAVSASNLTPRMQTTRLGSGHVCRAPTCLIGDG